MTSKMTLVGAYECYKSSHSEENLLRLSRAIEEVLGDFHPDVDYSCTYTALSEIVGDTTVNSLILSQSLSLLTQLVKEPSRRQSVLDKALPSISHQILYRYRQQPLDSILRLCLEFLKNTSFDATVKKIDGSTARLLDLLVRLVLKDSELLGISLSVLANLTRRSLLVQAHIKSMEVIRSLYTRLMRLLGSDEMRVIVYSLSLFASLCLTEDLGNKLFVGDAGETYTLVTNMLADSDPEIKAYCLDLLTDFTRSETMVAAFEECSLMEDLVDSDLLYCDPLIRDKVCKLIVELARRDQGLERAKSLLTTELMEMLVGQVGPDTADLLSLFSVLLPLEDTELTEKLAVSLVSIIENVPLHAVWERRYECVVLACRCLSLLLQDPLSQESVSSQLRERLPATLTEWLDRAPNPFDPSSQDLFSEGTVRALLEMTALLGRLNLDGSILEHPNLPPYIGKALLSGDQSTILLALHFARSCPTRSLDTAVSSVLAHKWHTTTSDTDALRREVTELNHRCTELQRQLGEQREAEMELCSSREDGGVSELITQMREGLQIKDLRSSQLLTLFQEKITVLTRKEEQLNDLVEAKTMALQQSDRLFTQFKNRVAQAERECAKYRELLQHAETESEERQDEMTRVLQAKNDLLSEVESLRSELKETQKYEEKYTTIREEMTQLSETHSSLLSTNSELAEKLEGLEEEVQILKVHNKTLKDQHEIDAQQAQVLQKEKEKVLGKLEEKDSLYLKTKQTLRQTEEKNRKKEKEKIELESQLMKTKSDLSKTESKFKELLEKESVLECKLSEGEKLIESQRGEIGRQCEEIEKYSKLMAMFHNLSSGKVNTRSRADG